MTLALFAFGISFAATSLATCIIIRFLIRRRQSRQWRQEISMMEWRQRMRKLNLGLKLPRQ